MAMIQVHNRRENPSGYAIFIVGKLSKNVENTWIFMIPRLSLGLDDIWT